MDHHTNLGGSFTPLRSSELSAAARLGATPLQVARAWPLHRSPNILLIPGTAPVAPLHENVRAATLRLPARVLADLDAIGVAKRGEARPVGAVAHAS